MIYTHMPQISCIYPVDVDEQLAASSAHFEYEIILVTAGNSQAIINNKQYSLKPQSLLFISRLEFHSFLIEPQPYHRYVVTISNEQLLQGIRDIELFSILMQRPKDFKHAIELSDEAYQKLLPYFVELEQEYRLQQDFYISKSVGLISNLLIDLFRYHPEAFPAHHNNISTTVLNAQRYVSEHYMHKLNLDEVADHCFIHRHTLSLAFKEFAGVTFKDYLLLFRISEAKKLLVTTDLSVEEIAAQVGYINVNNFVKIFKARETYTPLQYRKHFKTHKL